MLSGQLYLGVMRKHGCCRKRPRPGVRVDRQLDALIRVAADLESTTVTAFAAGRVTTRAQQGARSRRDLVLANEDFDRLTAGLGTPAKAAGLAALFPAPPQAA